jgi:hypothetical protein
MMLWRVGYEGTASEPARAHAMSAPDKMPKRTSKVGGMMISGSEIEKYDVPAADGDIGHVE